MIYRKRSEQQPKFCGKCGRALVPTTVVVEPPPPKFDIYTGEQTNAQPRRVIQDGVIECPNLARTGGMGHDWWMWYEREHVWTGG